VAFESFTDAEAWVSKMKLGVDDVFVTMGAGEAYKVAEKIFRLK
jgi:UDP-N-acetylmuramate-alanine ligase